MYTRLSWLNLKKNLEDSFYESIKKDIKLSHMQVNVREISGKFYLYSQGAKLLDEKLVDDVLDWLEPYPKKVKNYFAAALNAYRNGNYRDSADKMRVSFEVLLKSILKNHKSIEKQLEPLGRFLKDKNVPSEVGNMYSVLLIHYSKFENVYVKHNNGT